jgi:hypothetical protein
MTIKNKRIWLRLTESEYEALLHQKEQSLERSLSAFARKRMLQIPITVKYRNASADDFLEEMVPLKKELNLIAREFHQAVSRLQLLEKMPEFRVWLQRYEAINQEVLSKINDINSRLIQLHEQWSQ